MFAYDAYVPDCVIPRYWTYNDIMTQFNNNNNITRLKVLLLRRHIKSEQWKKYYGF